MRYDASIRHDLVSRPPRTPEERRALSAFKRNTQIHFEYGTENDPRFNFETPNTLHFANSVTGDLTPIDHDIYHPHSKQWRKGGHHLYGIFGDPKGLHMRVQGHFTQYPPDHPYGQGPIFVVRNMFPRNKKLMPLLHEEVKRLGGTGVVVGGHYFGLGVPWTKPQIRDATSTPETLAERVQRMGAVTHRNASGSQKKLKLSLSPFPFSLYPNEIMSKGQLRTQTPRKITGSRDIRSVLARLATDDDTEGVFTYNGKRYVMTPKGLAIHADQTYGKHRVPLDDEDEYGYMGEDDEEEVDNNSTLPVHGRPPVIIPHSLREWLRSQGFHSSYYDKVVDDNHAAHALDSRVGYTTEDDRATTRRRPAFFFAPGVYNELMQHLNTTGEVFAGPYAPRVPLEEQAYFIGTKHVDPESGIPWVVINDIIKSSHDHRRSTTHSKTMDEIVLNGYDEYFKKHPERYIAGHAHSHPPGGEALPSSGDIGLLSDQFVRRAPEGTRDYFARQGNPDALFMIHCPGAFHTHRNVLIHGPQAGEYIERFGRQVGPDDHYYDEMDPDEAGQPYGSGSQELTLGYKLPTLRQIGAHGSVTNFFHFVNDGSILPATHGFFGSRPVDHAHQITVASPRGGPQLLANTTLRTQYPINMYPGRMSLRQRIQQTLGEDEQGTNADGRKRQWTPLPVSWSRHLNGENDTLPIEEPKEKSFRQLRRVLQKSDSQNVTFFPFAIWPNRMNNQ